MIRSTFRLILGAWLLLGGFAPRADAQQWTGTAALGLSGGHQTNVYLDPMLGSWDRPSDPAFLALTPQVGLVRNARRTRIDLAGRARLYPRRSDVPQFLQGSARVRYRLSPSWTLGSTSGGTRYRLISSRDTWWALPSVQWTPGDVTAVTLRGGTTSRYVRTSQGTDRQTSGIAALTARTWITDRMSVEGRAYWSSGQTTMADANFGGTGASLRITYWPTSGWSIEMTVAAEQVQYDTGASYTARDRIGRGAVSTEWEIHPSVHVFGQAQALVARLAQTNEVETDRHISAGLRLQVHRVLGGTAKPPPRRQVCHPTESGARVQIPYDGPGTPHLTGDFNEWTLPGISMTRSDSSTWTTTLDLPPGQYTYRVHLVDDPERQWLDLPSYAQTTRDAFGGTNGVCTIH